MYPYLFGNETLRMYDLIGIMGYVILIAYYAINRNRLYFTDTCPKVWHVVLLPAVQMVAYTFAGESFGPLVGKGTEFFAFLSASALLTVLTAVVLGRHPLRWLDVTVPLYLTLAAVLKLGCFCGGCCRGMPWEWGLYNHATQRCEFPIQLVESGAYLLLLLLLRRYRGHNGQLFALFLTAYAAIRFAVQFFRADVAVFTPFHWMSAVFAAVGVAMWLLCRFAAKKEQCST